MPVTKFQPDLQSTTRAFVSKYVRRIPSAVIRQPGSHRDEIQLYVDMSRRDPVTRFCQELVFLYCYSLIGEYTHPRKRIEKDVRAAIANCKGSWSITLKQILTATWYGYSWTEVSTDDLSNGRKTLKQMRTLNPGRYDFEGDEEGIKTVRYIGQDRQEIKLDYNTGVHLVVGSDISFDDNYGCGRLEPAFPFWDLEQLLMPVLAIAGQRQATPILVKKTETGESVNLIDQSTGQPVLSAEGLPITVAKGWDAVRQLSELGSAGVTAIDPDDDLYQIEQNVAGDFLMSVLQLCKQRRMLSYLVPETLAALSGQGTGDSGLSERHMEVFESINAGLATYAVEEVVDQLIRPLIVHNFGDVGDWGEFPIVRSNPQSLDIARIAIDAASSGVLPLNDLKLVNSIRAALGIDELSQAALDELLEKQQVMQGASPQPEDQQSEPVEP